MTLHGACRHKLGDDRNELRGPQRREKIDELISGKHQGKTPSQLANDEIDSLSNQEYATNCHFGRMTDRTRAYNLFKEKRPWKRSYKTSVTTC